MFDQIERHHLIKAVELLRAEGIPRSNNSHTYAVRFEEDLFPPPLLVKTAHEIATGTIFYGRVAGGKNTPCFAVIKRHGFEIVRLDDFGKGMQPLSEEGFDLELDLELTLMKRWEETSFGSEFNAPVRQFQSDTGPIDLLAKAKDGNSFLILELKRDKATDKALGQLQRYMGYAVKNLCFRGQSVRGVIVAQRPDQALENALLVNPMIELWLVQSKPFKLTRFWS